MKAVVTTGRGGYEKLVFGDVAVPVLSPGDVLIRVLAAGINNTDINTRVGWYSQAVTSGTADATVGVEQGHAAAQDAGWNGPSPFPLIQGADCCGRIEAVGGDDLRYLIGRRVLVRSCMRPKGFSSLDTIWLGTDINGAFAEFVKVPGSDAFPIDCAWSDAELATIPCAYGTAENMLHRAGLSPGQRVLVTGASGGVGSASVQLARVRGAEVIAVTSRDKAEAVKALGCTQTLFRDEDPIAALGEASIDLVVDNVAGRAMSNWPKLLRRGGACVTSGAIGGPMVSFDLREIYLKDIRIIGCTAWDEPVFGNLINYIERGEIRPLLAGSYPLSAIAKAQEEFLRKRHVGNLVLIP